MSQSVKITADRGTKRVVAKTPTSSFGSNPHQARIRTPKPMSGISQTQRDAKVVIRVDQGLVDMGVSAGGSGLCTREDRGDYICAENISGQRIVKQNPDGTISYADHNDIAGMDATLGLSLQAGLAGGAISVLFFGEYSHAGWTWVPKKPIFLGTSGNITQTAPTTGFLLRIGFASEADEIVLRIDTPIVRA